VSTAGSAPPAAARSASAKASIGTIVDRFVAPSNEKAPVALAAGASVVLAADSGTT
jgi:hypothetical protein